MYIYIFAYAYVCVCIYIYVCVCVCVCVCTKGGSRPLHLAYDDLDLRKIFFYLEAFVLLNQPSCHSRAHLHCPPRCNTIARLLSSIRPPLLPPVCMPYTIQYCEGVRG